MADEKFSERGGVDVTERAALDEKFSERAALDEKFSERAALDEKFSNRGPIDVVQNILSAASGMGGFLVVAFVMPVPATINGSAAAAPKATIRDAVAAIAATRSQKPPARRGRKSA